MEVKRARNEKEKRNGNNKGKKVREEGTRQK